MKLRIEAQETINQDVTQDQFIHFTTRERAEQILKDNKLLMDPPYDKFGIDAVTAISTTYGTAVPGVQLTHIEGNPVAVLFQTTTTPQVGYVEEVVWKEDVNLINPKIISVHEALNMLKHAEPIEDHVVVTYE